MSSGKEIKLEDMRYKWRACFQNMSPLASKPSIIEQNEISDPEFEKNKFM